MIQQHSGGERRGMTALWRMATAAMGVCISVFPSFAAAQQTARSDSVIRLLERSGATEQIADTRDCRVIHTGGEAGGLAAMDKQFIVDHRPDPRSINFTIEGASTLFDLTVKASRCVERIMGGDVGNFVVRRDHDYMKEGQIETLQPTGQRPSGTEIALSKLCGKASGRVDIAMVAGAGWSRSFDNCYPRVAYVPIAADAIVILVNRKNPALQNYWNSQPFPLRSLDINNVAHAQKVLFDLRTWGDFTSELQLVQQPGNVGSQPIKRYFPSASGASLQAVLDAVSPNATGYWQIVKDNYPDPNYEYHVVGPMSDIGVIERDDLALGIVSYHQLLVMIDRDSDGAALPLEERLARHSLVALKYLGNYPDEAVVASRGWKIYNSLGLVYDRSSGTAAGPRNRCWLARYYRWFATASALRAAHLAPPASSEITQYAQSASCPN